MKIILDACAVIALVKDEVGGEIVEEYLLNSSHQCLIHNVNLCEVYYGFLRSDGAKFSDNIIDMLLVSNVMFCDDISINFWQQAATYKATIKRISLADCFALTLANQENGLLVTSDRKEFEPVVPLNICDIQFIR
ncbi:PIN domain-containing protein [Cyanobacterium sp. IPPAS B-1200]|uniref:PIN domain-containing protein n=1 Tax=Cyanobacterium sp. IPPAS B-1200 TaxID=1562720 RepID=UPI0008528819|nr:PIN domain-containing protein [Cyanobacterium sp. IPPAS B-1200]OEJ77406.1 PIN domain protein [Cyanobacterium sp. IPPAS B-1200]